MTSLFICNYIPSRLISWEDRHVCLVSKGESIILIDGYFRDAGSICRRVCGSVFFFLSLSLFFSPFSLSLFLLCTLQSFSSRGGKTKREKRQGRDIVRFPWQNADKSVWSPRRGRRLWKSRETGTRARKRARDERTDPFKSSYSRHSSSALFARGVAYDGGCHCTSEVAFRSLARSRHLLFPGPFPRLASGAVFFTGYCLEHTFHGHPMRPRTMSDVRVSRACERHDNTFSV